MIDVHELHDASRRVPRCVRRAPAVLAFAALIALGAGGVEVAYAGSSTPDLAPSAKELFSANARSISLPSGSSCNPASVKQAQEQRREVMARVMARMMGGEGDPGRALRNGYGYRPSRNPMQVLERVEREAAAQRARLAP